MEKGPEELSEMMEMFYTLSEVLVTKVWIFEKTREAIRLRPVRLTVSASSLNKN